MKPRLVHSADSPIDIHALNRAAIEQRDWDAVHIIADKRKPVEISEPRKRGWRA